MSLISKESRWIDPISTKRQEKLKKRWKNNSFWHKLKRGHSASTLYAMAMYPYVFFNRYISKKSRHPSLTVYQETAIRTIKRSLNSSLSVIRNNSALMESPLRMLRCSEPTELVNVAGVKGYWLGPKTWKGMQPQAILLYVHGGGYVSSSLSGIQSLCYLLETLREKHDRHIRALTVSYALAPENPYPGALNSITRAYRWLTTGGMPGSQKVFLCGASSGGTLVLALLQRLYLDTALPRPLGAILISPWVDISCNAPSYSSNSKSDILTTYFCQLAAENYLSGNKGNKKPQEGDANSQKDQKGIFAWLDEVDNNDDTSNIGNESVRNEEKRSSEWRHEVVSVKRHSGEGTKSAMHRKIKRNSKMSRSSRSSRSSRASRTSRAFRSSGYSRNLQITDTIETTETTNEYHEGVAGAYATLTSKHTISNNSVKRNNSIVRFSDSLAIHIQTDLNEVINTRRESWTRNSHESHQKSSVPGSILIGRGTANSFSSRIATAYFRTSLASIPSSRTDTTKDPFLNPMISPLYTPQNLLAKFPPLFVSYGGQEIFRDDIETFCQKCVKSKNVNRGGRNKKNLEKGKENKGISAGEAIETHPDVVIELDKDMIHSYPMLLGIFGEHSKKALIKIAAFLNAHIPDSSRPLPILRANSISSNHIDASRSPKNSIPHTASNKLSRNYSSDKRRQKSRKRSKSIAKSADIKNIPVTKVMDAENTVPIINVTGVADVKNVSVTKVAVKNIDPKPPIQSIEFSSSTLSEQTIVFPVISSPSSSHRSSRNRRPKNVTHRRRPSISTHSVESVQTQKSDQSRLSRQSAASRTSVFKTNGARISMLLYKDAEREVIPNSRRATLVSVKKVE